MAGGATAPFRIHDQRHTVISLWIMAGINPKDVSVYPDNVGVPWTLQPINRSETRGTTRGTTPHES